MITIDFNDIYDRECTIYIDNGDDGDDIELTPSATPFVTTEDDNDDIFTPIRPQTGTIGVMCEVGDLNAIIGANPLERPVTFKVNNTVKWVGFLQSDAYTQTWDRGANEMEIPVVSGLGLLENLAPNWSENKQYGFITFAQLVKEINTRLGGIYQYALFPSRNNPTTTLGYSFLRMNYMDLDDEYVKDGALTFEEQWKSTPLKFECESYKKILEDVCTVFGWSLQERGDKLYFLAPDIETTYIAFPISRIDELDDEYDETVETMNQTTFTTHIFGASHNISYNQGKKSVKVTNNTNNSYQELFKFDIDKHQFIDASNKQSSDKNVITYYYTRNFANNRQLYAPRSLASIGNVRYYNYTTPHDAGTLGAYGASINNEGCLIDDIGKATETGDAALTTRIICHNESSVSAQRCIMIKMLPCVPDAFDWVQTLLLTGNVSVADGETGEFQPYTGNLLLSLMNEQGKYYNYSTHSWGDALATKQITAKDGTITTGNVGTTKYDSLVLGYTGAKIYGDEFYDTAISGTFIVTLYIPADEKRYIAITDLAIKRSFNWHYFGGRGEVADKNEAYYIIGNGFQDDYERECTLAVSSRWRSVYDISAGITKMGKSLQTGKGIIQNGANQVTTLGVEKTPEFDLANRAKWYYNETRKKVVVTMNTSTFDGDLLKQYYVTDQDLFAICGQSVNWRECESETTFIETTNQL